MKNIKLWCLFALLSGSCFLSGCSSGGTVTNTSAAASPGTSEVKKEEPSKTPQSSNEKAKTSDSSSRKIESVYTDISSDKCKTTESNEEQAWIVQICDGVGGYKLEVFEGDLRQSINVIAPGGKKAELNFQANVGGGFSALGEKAEWRVEKKDGKTVPVALIVRFNESNAENEGKNTSYLVVSKITGDSACVTDVIKPSANANEEARKAADSAAGKACKSN